jgi:hypothetical protein
MSFLLHLRSEARILDLEEPQGRHSALQTSFLHLPRSQALATATTRQRARKVPAARATARCSPVTLSRRLHQSLQAPEHPVLAPAEKVLALVDPATPAPCSLLRKPMPEATPVPES